MIVGVAFAAMALALLLHWRRTGPELAGLRARESVLARRCDEVAAADARARAASAEPGPGARVDHTESFRLIDELYRVRVRIGELESLGW